MQRRGRMAALVLTAGLTLSTVACTDDTRTKPSELTDSPSTSASASQTSPSSASPSAASEEEAVIAAYKGWFETVNGMGLATDEEVAAALAPYATNKLIENAVAVFSAERAKGVIPGGTVNFGKIEVEFTGQGALVRECRNSSTETSVDAATGNVVGTGSAGTRYEAKLSKNSQGLWLMSDYSALPDQC